MLANVQIKRIDLWSLFKIAFFLYAGLGLVAGLIFATVGMFAAGLGDMLGEVDEDFDFGFVGGIVSIFLMPVFAVLYGAMGSVMITVVGFLFNLTSRIVGGIKFETEIVELAGTSEPPAPKKPPKRKAT